MNMSHRRGTVVGATLVIVVGCVVFGVSHVYEARLADVAPDASRAAVERPAERSAEVGAAGEVPVLAEAAASMDDAGRRVVTVTGCRRFCI
jgi:uncharacterized metal-binding protein